MRVMGARLLAAAMAIVVGGCGGKSATILPLGGSLNVTTQSGAVNGTSSGGARLFLGIPYAAPPVGALRFQPPQPHAAWTTALDATKPGTICPQFGPPTYPFGADQETSEDCLTLNVTTPASGAGLPVMVWIHGGSFTQGSGAFYPATALATQGNVVVVTINYRLGILGYLGTTALDAAAGGKQKTANYGVEDQIAALQWVKQNIAAFGGDASRMTIAGESAGAISVCALEANAAAGGAAAGLFSRAIVESGPCQAPLGTFAASEANGASLASQMGCSQSGAAQVSCLQSLPLSTILAAQKNLTLGGAAPSAGGADVPEQPKAAIGAFPTLMGGNRYEWGLFIALGLPPAPTSASGYNATLSGVYGAAAPAVQNSPQYTYTNFNATPVYPQGFLALTTAMSDFAPADPLSVCYDVVNWQKAATSANPIYAYEFSDPSAPTTLPFAPFSSIVPPGPLHAAEIQYLFPGLAAPPSATAPAGGPQLSGAEAALSTQMIRAWTNFVASGNPNGGGAPAWTPYQSGTNAVQLTTAGSGTIDVDAEHNCTSFWGPLFASTGLLQ